MSDSVEKVRPFLSISDAYNGGYHLIVLHLSNAAPIGDRHKVRRPLRFSFGVYGVF